MIHNMLLPYYGHGHLVCLNLTCPFLYKSIDFVLDLDTLKRQIPKCRDNKLNLLR